MTIALVSHVEARSVGGGDFTSGAINTTGANFIAVAVGAQDGNTVFTVTDNQSNGNATKLIGRVYAGAGTQINIFYWTNPTVAASHTFTINKNGGANMFGVLSAVAFSGVDTTSPADSVTNSASVANTKSAQPGSITPTNANELVVAAMCQGITDTISVDSSMTLYQLPVSGGNGFGISLGWVVQGSAAAINPTFSWTTTNDFVPLVIGAFIAAAGGGITGPLLSGHLLSGGPLLGRLVR